MVRSPLRLAPSRRPFRRADAAWWRAEWAGLVLLYAVAVLVRLSMWKGEVYGDEAAHFSIARTFGERLNNVYGAGDPAALFWQRPLFFLLLAPGALISFDAYRLLHVGVAALLPVLLAAVLRDLGVRRGVAYAGAAAVVVHPTFVLGAVRVFPDTLMTFLFAAGIWAWIRNQPVLHGALWVAAVWVKEVAWVGVVFGLAWSLIRGHRAGTTLLWPLRLDRPQTALAAAAAVGPVPLLASVVSYGSRFPGWAPPRETWQMLDGPLLTVWLLPLLLLGLRWPRTRRWASLALVYPVFFLAYRLLLHRGVETWYFVLPNLLVILAVGLVLDEGLWRYRGRRSRGARVGAAVVGLFLLALLAADVILPKDNPLKPLVTPVAAEPRYALGEVVRDVDRSHDLDATLVALDAGPGDTLFLVDVGWFYIDYPFAMSVGYVYFGYTEPSGGFALLGSPDGFVGLASEDNWTIHIPAWSSNIEEASNTTVLWKTLSPLNQAIRQIYADCTTYENPSYVLLHGPGCPGRAAELARTYDRLRGVDPGGGMDA